MPSVLNGPLLQREFLGILIVAAIIGLAILWMIVSLESRIESLEKRLSEKDRTK